MHALAVCVLRPTLHTSHSRTFHRTPHPNQPPSVFMHRISVNTNSLRRVSRDALSATCETHARSSRGEEGAHIVAPVVRLIELRCELGMTDVMAHARKRETGSCDHMQARRQPHRHRHRNRHTHRHRHSNGQIHIHRHINRHRRIHRHSHTCLPAATLIPVAPDDASRAERAVLQLLLLFLLSL